MKFTRRLVLDAIRKEPLAPGNFINQTNCKVCAVGAVLRRSGVQDGDISLTAHDVLRWGQFLSSGSWEEEIEHGLYLNALSIRFEQLAESYGSGKRTREKLANWVKEHLPTEFDA